MSAAHALPALIEQVIRAKRAALSQWAHDDDEGPDVEEIAAIEGVPERNLYVIDGVLTASECKQIIIIAESQGAFVHYTSPNSPEYAFRDHHRVKFRSPGIADVLWNGTDLKKAFETRIQRIGGRATGLNPELKLYRYAGSESFGKHIDCSETVEGMGRTEYTVLFYLSSTKGGETAFYDDDGAVVARIVPEQGRVVLHRHGERYCLDHEALQVVDGVKYVLRTDVVFQES